MIKRQVAAVIISAIMCVYSFIRLLNTLHGTPVPTEIRMICSIAYIILGIVLIYLMIKNIVEQLKKTL